MSRLTKRIVEDKLKYENQEMIDAILDKINEYGMDSLTDKEKHIINNPDEKFEPEEDEIELDAAEEIIFSNEAMSRLISSELISYDEILILDDNSFQVNNIIDEDGYGFEYFEPSASVSPSIVPNSFTIGTRNLIFLSDIIFNTSSFGYLIALCKLTLYFSCVVFTIIIESYN